MSELHELLGRALGPDGDAPVDDGALAAIARRGRTRRRRKLAAFTGAGVLMIGAVVTTVAVTNHDDRHVRTIDPTVTTVVPSPTSSAVSTTSGGSTSTTASAPIVGTGAPDITALRGDGSLVSYWPTGEQMVTPVAGIACDQSLPPQCPIVPVAADNVALRYVVNGALGFELRSHYYADPQPVTTGSGSDPIQAITSSPNGRTQLFSTDPPGMGAFGPFEPRPSVSVSTGALAISPDEKRLVYVAVDGGSSPTRHLVVRDLATGAERTVPTRLGPAFPAVPDFVQWSPDAHHLVVQVAFEGSVTWLVDVDAASSVSDVVELGSERACWASATQLVVAAWQSSPTEGTATPGQLALYDIATGQRQRFGPSFLPGTLACRADGSAVVLSPTSPGDLVHVRLDGTTEVLAAGVASVTTTGQPKPSPKAIAAPPPSTTAPVPTTAAGVTSATTAPGSPTSGFAAWRTDTNVELWRNEAVLLGGPACDTPLSCPPVDVRASRSYLWWVTKTPGGWTLARRRVDGTGLAEEVASGAGVPDSLIVTPDDRQVWITTDARRGAPATWTWHDGAVTKEDTPWTAAAVSTGGRRLVYAPLIDGRVPAYPDGRRLVVRDLATGQEVSISGAVTTTDGPPDKALVTSLAWSPDARTVLLQVLLDTGFDRRATFLIDVDSARSTDRARPLNAETACWSSATTLLLSTWLTAGPDTAPIPGPVTSYDLTKEAKNPANPFGPDWMPSKLACGPGGSAVLVAPNRSGPTDLVVVHPDGSTKVLGHDYVDVRSA